MNMIQKPISQMTIKEIKAFLKRQKCQYCGGWKLSKPNKVRDGIACECKKCGMINAFN